MIPAREPTVLTTGPAHAVLVIFCLLLAGPLQAAKPDPTELESREVRAQYESALASGNESKALKILLDYAEHNHGENAAETAKLTHRYGHALYREFRFREATSKPRGWSEGPRPRFNRHPR